MEERVSGFREQGTWEDGVEHGERITTALASLDVDHAALEEWDDWRPKAHEELEDEVSEKTVEQASLEEGAGERAGQAPAEDLERAGQKALGSIEKAEEDGPADILEKWEESIEHALRAADTTSRKVFRTAERAVYERVMTRFVPYYFDNDHLSANIRRTSRLEDGDAFVFEVNPHDDLKRELGRRLGTSAATEE